MVGTQEERGKQVSDDRVVTCTAHILSRDIWGHRSKGLPAALYLVQLQVRVLGLRILYVLMYSALPREPCSDLAMLSPSSLSLLLVPSVLGPRALPNAFELGVD